MNLNPELLLVGAVGTVGVLHTIVPDHWVPITLIARQRGWSKIETARAAVKAGTGHVLSTLAIALVVWFAGVAVAKHFGHMVDLASSVALIAFGLWIAVSALREMDQSGGHPHPHHHDHSHPHSHNHESRSHDQNHDHPQKTNSRTALILVLGSSPMVEGIPAFFAAGKYGIGLILLMSAIFALSTILTYVLLCVYSTAGLKRIKWGAFERYGEVLSGAFIAVVGLAFWIWPGLG